MRSFKDAREAFATNLQSILTELHYTPTTLAMKLSGLSSSGKSVATGQNVNDWILGNAIPNVYQFFKLSQLLRLPIDDMFDSDFDISTFSGRAFVRPRPIEFPAETTITLEQNKPDAFEDLRAIILKQKPTINKATATKGTTTMATNNTITISKTQDKAMREIVRGRTDSKNANRVLAYRIYNSDYTLKQISETVGCSTRSLRDYAFYGVTMTEDIANNLRSFFNTTYHNLGIYLNRETGRFEALKVTVKV